MASPDVEVLLGQLNLEEKISLLAAENVWETPEIKRLQIPSLKVTDGPNGARGGDFYDGTTAACFPACVSIAATFNPDLARRIGQALGQEAQTKGAYVLLGPTVCCHRSPLGGRNFEAFSEDPFLSGSLASAYVNGLQSERVAATMKHFVGNEQDTRRFSINEIISERALREIYLRPFEMVVKDADPWCVMTSYPKINGLHVDAQTKFLLDILRNQWGYQGLVMSDWGATSTVESVKYGLDLEMPGPAQFRTPQSVRDALEAGQASSSDIDERVWHTLKLLEKVGKFSDRKATPKEQAIDNPGHRALIREAGGEGLVLLKNENRILPIDVTKDKKIALLGPLAKYAGAHGGGSASLNCHYKISPYEAFEQRLGSQVELTYSKGAHIHRVYPELEQGTSNKNGTPGFCAEYFLNATLSGEPFHQEEFPRGYFTTLMDTAVVGTQSIRFSTSYRPSESGQHHLSFSGIGPSKLFINGAVVADQPEPTKDSMAFLLGVQDELRLQYSFAAGKIYDIVIETRPSPIPNSELHLLNNQLSAHLGFVSEADMAHDLQSEAVALARAADLAILVVGNTTQWETEGQDLSSMRLPAAGSQDALVAAVAAANPRTVVVIVTGVPVELPWLDDVGAVLQAWYAGQESGNAILDALVGAVVPSGKLPVSWPKAYADAPCFGHFVLDASESDEVRYVEDVFVGYRHYDRVWGTARQVRFPFGFGLSYTEFAVTNVRASGSLSGSAGSAGGVVVSAAIRNIGQRAGAETLQIYLAPPQTALLERPVKELVGYAKVSLQPGEEKTVQIAFPRSAAAYWDESVDSWRVVSGRYEVVAATSSQSSDIQARIPLDVDEGFTFAA